MSKTTQIFVDTIVARLMPRYALLGATELTEKGIIRTEIIDVLSKTHRPTWEAIINENKDVSFTREFIAESCKIHDNCIGHIFNIEREVIINITHPLIEGALRGLNKQNKTQTSKPTNSFMDEEGKWKTTKDPGKLV